MLSIFPMCGFRITLSGRLFAACTAVGVISFHLQCAFAAEPPIFEVGIDADNFQTEFDRKQEKGYRLVDLTGYVENRRLKLGWVWKKTDNVEWKALANMTLEEIQKAVPDADTAVLQLRHLSAVRVGGEERYSAIWEKTAAPAITIRYGYPGDKLQRAHSKLVSLGNRPMGIAATSSNAGLRFSAFWEKDTVPARELQIGLGSAQLKKEFHERAASQFRLVQICGYPVANRDRYAVIWEKAIGSQQEFQVGLTEVGLRRVHTQKLKNGFQPSRVSGYVIKGRARFAVIWEKPAEP